MGQGVGSGCNDDRINDFGIFVQIHASESLIARALYGEHHPSAGTGKVAICYE
jgi:hypothetical protein